MKQCDDLMIDGRFFDYPWCMWGGVETNEEHCQQCLKDKKDWAIKDSAEGWKRLFKEK